MKKFITEVFKDPPILITKNLVLRKLERTDYNDMYEYASLSEVTKYLTWDPHPDLQYTRKYLTFIGAKYKACDFFDWAVCLRDSGKMIGTCGFTELDERNMCGEIGYVINPKYRGNGYAEEAAKRFFEFGFEELALQRIQARFMVGNEASRHVMEKLGMQFEGINRNALHVRGKFVSVGVYSILRDELYKIKTTG